MFAHHTFLTTIMDDHPMINDNELSQPRRQCQWLTVCVETDMHHPSYMCLSENIYISVRLPDLRQAGNETSWVIMMVIMEWLVVHTGRCDNFATSNHCFFNCWFDVKCDRLQITGCQYRHHTYLLLMPNTCICWLFVLSQNHDLCGKLIQMANKNTVTTFTEHMVLRYD